MVGIGADYPLIGVAMVLPKEGRGIGMRAKPLINVCLHLWNPEAGAENRKHFPVGPFQLKVSCSSLLTPLLSPDHLLLIDAPRVPVVLRRVCLSFHHQLSAAPVCLLVLLSAYWPSPPLTSCCLLH